jgi:NADH-quinone oxidoreductase subunit M
VHHRNIDEFGGLFNRMPVYSGIAIVIFFAALGLPGLCGFIGEVMVTLSVWNYSKALAIISASVVILTAGYILWTVQRVYLGPQYKGPHGDHLTAMDGRELAIATPLVFFAILFGVVPQTLLDYMEPSVTQSVEDLRDWTEEVKTPQLSDQASIAAPSNSLAAE